MKILIAGATGLVGSALIPFLRNQGHHVKRISRTPTLSDDEVVWDPDTGQYNLSDFEGYDAVINLAGENIASGRWTEARKKLILESRLSTTNLLCKIFASLKNSPKVLVNASAMGFYGSRGNEELTESSQDGKGYLADVCRQWEAAVEQASKQGIRVVCLRFGMILSAHGGALKKMLLPFKMGFGGVIGSGDQYMSWVSIEDVVHVIQYLLNSPISGPVNVGTPHPVTNREFTKTLGRVLHRPTIMPLPAFVVKTVFGEMGEELLLSSTRMLPKRLMDSSYMFIYPTLEPALEALLKLN